MRPKKKKKRKISRKGRCRLCRSKSKEPVDYKDVAALQRFCTGQGKIYSRKRSGSCAKHQRQIKLAIKRARFLGLLR